MSTFSIVRGRPVLRRNSGPILKTCRPVRVSKCSACGIMRPGRISSCNVSSGWSAGALAGARVHGGADLYLPVERRPATSRMIGSLSRAAAAEWQFHRCVQVSASRQQASTPVRVVCARARERARVCRVCVCARAVASCCALLGAGVLRARAPSRVVRRRVTVSARWAAPPRVWRARGDKGVCCKTAVLF